MIDAAPHTVLVVDDDQATRVLLTAELSAAGYTALQAPSGVEGLAMLETGCCRIVITDWLMPDLDGVELCRRVRADPALTGTYVIMITVNGDQPRLMEAFEAGVDDFLSKPFEPGILLARMRAASRTVDLQDALLLRNAQLRVMNERLEKFATTDELTGLPNRRQGLTHLRARWAEAERHGRPLSVALVDIDHFKKINDTYGHAVGDHVLAEVAQRLLRGCREGDIVCRFGGEEFLCVLPDADGTSAVAWADRARNAIADHRTVEGGLSLSVTASIGVATRSCVHHSERDLVRSADDGLYTAKEGGRNAVVLAVP